jgi:hypothetical protein
LEGTTQQDEIRVHPYPAAAVDAFFAPIIQVNQRCIVARQAQAYLDEQVSPFTVPTFLIISKVIPAFTVFSFVTYINVALDYIVPIIVRVIIAHFC